MTRRQQKISEAAKAVQERMDASPREINNGLCADFGDLVWNKLGRPDWINFTDNVFEGQEEYRHSWISQDGLHFDAEAPEGVEDWRQLPIFQRIRQNQ